MKFSPRLAIFATSVLSAALAVPGAMAQQQQQAAQNPYQGVSQPPPDDSIVTTDTAAPLPPVKLSKPSAAVPVARDYSAPAQRSVPIVSSVSNEPTHATNSDDYMITQTTSQLQYAQDSAGAPSNAVLETRPVNPDAGIVSVIPSAANQLAEGTDISARLLHDLSTTSTIDGSRFEARVGGDVYKDGRVVIPAGSELRGRVVQVSQGHRMGGRATLRLRPDAVVLPDGSAYHLYAQLIEVKANGARTDSEGGIQPSRHLKKDAIEYGAGAGTGAVVGAQVGGPPGALVGSLVGAGVVTTHMLVQPPMAVDVPEGSLLVFSLTEPMDLLPTRN